MQLFYTEADEVFTSGFDKLASALRQHDQDTLLLSLNDPAQVCVKLDKNNCITSSGNYRLSGPAIKQLCYKTCPGLFSVVMALSRGNNSRFLAEAATVFNTCITRFFTKNLEDTVMVANSRTKVIDGIVGRKYRRLPNAELLDRMSESVDQIRVGDCKPVLESATRSGRSMFLQYNLPGLEISASLKSGYQDLFRLGIFIANSEIGDGALRAAISIIRHDGLRSLSRYTRRNRIIHAGSDFNRRFHELIGFITERLPTRSDVLGKLVRLSSADLGFSVSNSDKRLETIVSGIKENGIASTAARKIIHSALVQGAYDRFPVANHGPSGGWVGKTYLDLFVAIGRYARDISSSQRERLEQLSWELLISPLRF